MYRIGIVGGGAAGMMAACAAAETLCAAGRSDVQVVLLEQNEKLGKKLYITGKGRCNLTNTCETAECFEKIVRNAKFLYSAIYGFDHEAVMSFFEESGVDLKIERGGRVFPVSDHASDITRALERRSRRAGVQIRLHTQVRQILMEKISYESGVSRLPAAECDGIRPSEDAESAGILPPDAAEGAGGGASGRSGKRSCVTPRGRIAGLEYTDGSREDFAAVIIATGGISYPQTGSRGDGYRFARRMGHEVTPCRPSLVPFEIRETWCAQLQGLSLRNVSVRLYACGADGSAAGTDEKAVTAACGANENKVTTAGRPDGKAATAAGVSDAESAKDAARSRTPSPGKLLAEEFGEMLFTHFGVSGPVILTLSAIPTQRQIDAGLTLSIDLKPALDPQQLDRRLLRDFEKYANKDMANAMRDLLPQRLIPVVLSESGIPADQKARDLTKARRIALGQILKGLTLHVRSLRGFGEAVITRGGVSVRDVDPSTMESKKVGGLYFAGEVIDVDALTGGYNLQIAWSSGHLAGISAAEAAVRHSSVPQAAENDVGSTKLQK